MDREIDSLLMNVTCLIGVLFILVSLMPSFCYGVTITVDQAPPTIVTDPFSITVSVLGASAGQNYLRVDLYKEGSTNYFGETFNGTEWYKDSVGTKYFPVTIIDSSTPVTATLQSRLGQPSPSEFGGEGEYLLRVRRYTASGNPGNDMITPVKVQVAYSFPTSTPTPTSVPTPTRLPTPTKTPTPSPTVVVVPTKIPTVTPFKEPATNSYEEEVDDIEPTAVLGISDMSVSPTSRPIKSSPVLTKGATQGKPNYIAAILCSVGAVLLIACGILFYLNKRKVVTL